MLTIEQRMQKLLVAPVKILARIDQVLTGEDSTSGNPETDVSTCTLTEAARRLRLSRPTVHRLVDSGRLLSVRLNGKTGRRVVISSLVCFVNNNGK